MRSSPGDANVEVVTPPGFNARTHLHGYGGGSHLVNRSTVYFSSFSDQRLYRQDPGGEPRAITPEPDRPAGARYADGRVTADGRLMVCVRELHAEDREPTNEIVLLPTDGSAPPRAVVSRQDFYSFPDLGANGQRLDRARRATARRSQRPRCSRTRPASSRVHL